MDNNKKQNYSRTGNTKTPNQTTDSSNRQKSSSSDIQTTKYWPKLSRRRENPSTSTCNNCNSNTNKQQPSTKVRANVDKRPRARGNNGYNNITSGPYCSTNQDYFATGSGLGSGNVASNDTLVEGASFGRLEHIDYEMNSVYSPGSKKQNLNHLLNFYCTPRDVDYYDSGFSGIYSHNQRHGHAKKHKYNKELFLHANFQFVIKASAKRKTDDSVDTLIDWSLIEQINIQTPEELQCPICLYPPVAAKVTRCGHVYCWPCVLHYLSLSDKTWRKCPICYDAIHVGDLKSASIVKQKPFNVDSYITFNLMRRKRDSLFIEKEDGMKHQIIDEYPYFSSPEEQKLFSKFILARRSDVAVILSRERQELLADVDEACPEYVFIQKALDFLKERSGLLGDLEQNDEKDKTEKICLNQNNIDNKDKISNTDLVLMEQTNDLKKNDSSKTLNEVKISNQTTSIEQFLKSFSISESSSCSQLENIQKSTKYHYFYQSDDGQNIYLHPLNVKMLQACYGSLSDAPTTIKARIIQKEQYSMDEDRRRKFTCLGHLPLTCQFSVVEIELQPPYVTEDIIQAFQSEIQFRRKERKRRAKEEREREKHINAINDRQMGKLITSAANINISSSEEFPTCGFEESLSASGFDTFDNVPSTSKGGRTKTISTSSAGSSSYSAIALHCQQEHTPWSTLNAAPIAKTLASDTMKNDEEISVLSTIQTNLGDVLAQALSQKKKEKNAKSKEATNPNGNKKSKKSKKRLPLYSTGMNFNSN